MKIRFVFLSFQYPKGGRMTNAATKDIEHELSACMDELERAVLDNDTESAKVLIKRAAAQLAERNRLCKLNK